MTVESGVPIGPVGSGRPLLYPWPHMSPGDSFLIPFPAGPSRTRKQAAVHGAGSKWCQAHAPHLRCKSRQVEGGIRVWLVPNEEAA